MADSPWTSDPTPTPTHPGMVQVTLVGGYVSANATPHGLRLHMHDTPPLLHNPATHIASQPHPQFIAAPVPVGSKRPWPRDGACQQQLKQDASGMRDLLPPSLRLQVALRYQPTGLKRSRREMPKAEVLAVRGSGVCVCVGGGTLAGGNV